MPYIALQLVGLEAVLRTMGLNGTGIAGHLPLFIAFVILAVYTYQSGLRAPGADRVRQGHPDLRRDPRGRDLPAGAARRLVGDLRGGVGQARPAQPGHRPAARLDPADREQPAAVRHPRPGLGAGAVPLPALAHRHPGLPRPQRDQAQHDGAAGVLAAARACWRCWATWRSPPGAKPITNNATGRPDTNTIIPVLFDQQFNAFFAGIAFAAIGIGALVPAAIMSIAAANLWTRNIYKEYLQAATRPRRRRRSRRSSPRWWSSSARCCSSSRSTRSSPSTCSSSAA